MKNAASLFLLSCLALASAACGGGGSAAVTCNGTALVANEANNYQFSSTLSFPPIMVQPKTELTFDWGSVTKDFNGHAVDPKRDLNMISLIMWNLTLEDLQTKLNLDSLVQNDLTTVPLAIVTDGNTTSAKLFTFTVTGGGAVDPSQITAFFDDAAYPPASHIYTLIAANGTVVGQGSRMIQSFRLDPNSTNTNVKMTSQSTKLEYTANLQSLRPTAIPAGQAAITLDWGKMTTNAMGRPFDVMSITNALIGHYTQTPAQLEKQFLDLEIIGTELYRGSIDTGSVVDFSLLKTGSGQSFAGIDDTGTWVVALQCGGCRNPAPWYLSVLKPCTAK